MAFYLLFYRIFIWLYRTGVWIAAWKNPKAAQWLEGRRHWQQRLQQARTERFEQGRPVVWMHCASLGEFEQGRPVLEKLKAANPHIHILVSFFSPSGYEIRKNYTGADMVCYLPMDGAAAAATFLRIVQPSLVLWVKYEYWYDYLTAIRNRQIPLLLVSGIFRQNQPFFKWYGALYRRMLRSFTALFVQNESSAQLARQIVDPERVLVAGDTRFDRVIEIAEHFQPVPAVAQWLDGASKIMVCGSTWDEDEKELSHYIRLHPEIRFMIAPHNVNEAEITALQQLLPGAVLYSQLEQRAVEAVGHVLIIDTIGILSRLYHYATVAYIGGGFGAAGIHNVLEAAVYGKPVVHGPEYHKFAEARDLVAAGASFETKDAIHLEQLLDRLFGNPEVYDHAARAAREYVYNRQGATAAILRFIQEKRLLTSS